MATAKNKKPEMGGGGSFYDCQIIHEKKGNENDDNDFEPIDGCTFFLDVRSGSLEVVILDKDHNLYMKGSMSVGGEVVLMGPIHPEDPPKPKGNQQFRIHFFKEGATGADELTVIFGYKMLHRINAELEKFVKDGFMSSLEDMDGIINAKLRAAEETEQQGRR